MKRFTETEKWNDPWFRRLPMAVKCLWNYLCDRCDAAGVIELDLELAGMDIGHKFHESDVNLLVSRMEKIGGEKWRIRKFLEFQYGTLDAKCRGQTNVIKAVQKHGIPYPILNLGDRVSHRVSDTLQERTGQDRTGKDQEESPPAGARVSSPPAAAGSGSIPTLETALEWAAKFSQGNAWALVISPEMVRAWYDDRSVAGWEIPRGQHMVPIADWQADLRDFTKWKLSGGGTPHKKNGGAQSGGGLGLPKAAPVANQEAPAGWKAASIEVLGFEPESWDAVPAASKGDVRDWLSKGK